MGETGKLCAAAPGGVPCEKPGTRQMLASHDVHEQYWFYLCEAHAKAWEAGQITIERLDARRVVEYTA
jgi:hypothetical protein